MATANFSIDAEDGWTEVTSASTSFVKIRSNSPSHAFFVTTGSSTPAASVVGYKVQCEEFWCDVTVADNYYVRVAENLPQETRFDVFFVLT